LPGPVVQPVPGFGVVADSAKPLNADGAEPPLGKFSFDHCAPQKVTAPDALRSQITKVPPPDA